ncbi:hypothetical protein OG738_06840 [Amycolatopsis sp. NBC_01488]|uniref:hypothetical protein n=1 Tax=Amycolatopsis sp. NBC_01488 TaxID=2903563 RepID=UPI002E2D5D19|nr:hypothetical protein [Amycolatopsis sp. NBC_01488]
MRQTWTLSGAYANWKLTVAIEPGEYALGVPEWPGEKLAPVVGHFFEAVNHYELGRDAEQLHRLS